MATKCRANLSTSALRHTHTRSPLWVPWRNSLLLDNQSSNRRSSFRLAIRFPDGKSLRATVSVCWREKGAVDLRMACLQLLKSSPSNPQDRFGRFCSRYSSRALAWRRRLRLQESGIVLGGRRLRVACKAEDGDNRSNGEEATESLFSKELKRRGMTPDSLREERNRSSGGGEEVKFREEDGGWGYSRRNGVTTDAETNLSGQREKSMALNSEGLEGLIPRAKALLTLGATFFQGFWPLILVTVGSFSALYLYFGAEFVHDGSRTSSSSPPQYVDPYDLLEDGRIYDKTAPLLK